MIQASSSMFGLSSVHAFDRKSCCATKHRLGLCERPHSHMLAWQCRVQYPAERQQQLISHLSTLTSDGNATLPQLLQANAFISDVVALGFAGSVDPSSILRTATAVAAAPAAAEGFGMYLLVLPAVEALQQLSWFTYVRF